MYRKEARYKRASRVGTFDSYLSPPLPSFIASLFSSLSPLTKFSLASGMKSTRGGRAFSDPTPPENTTVLWQIKSLAWMGRVENGAV